MKRCKTLNCKKRCNKDGLCKFHRHRHNEYISRTQFSYGCQECKTND